MPASLLAQTAAQVGGQTAAGAMGLLLGRMNDKRQLKQQQKLTDQQVKANKELADYSHNLQYDMWNKTNYGAQVEQLKAAGLNPALIYGQSGGGGVTTGSASAGSATGGQAPSGGGEVAQMMGMGLQLQLLKAQKENIEADTKKKLTEAEYTGGAQTDLTKQETANRVLDGILKKYTGLEAKDQYEQVKAPNRGVEAETYNSELEARQATAKTLVDLWMTGDLQKKSLEEIEGIVLTNAKTRAERRQIEANINLLEERTKGQKLENIITELEAKLQTETGIDKSSPGYLKILGRLFVNLMGGSTAVKAVMENTGN